MTPERLKEINARCEAAEETGANLHHTVVRACLTEIERLRELIERIATDKGGNVWATFSFNPIEECRKILDLKK